MPKDKTIYKDLIPRAYRKQTIDNWLFAYTISAQKHDKQISLKNTFLSFAKTFDLSEDEYSLEHMQQTWYRMCKDYIELEKS